MASEQVKELGIDYTFNPVRVQGFFEPSARVELTEEELAALPGVGDALTVIKAKLVEKREAQQKPVAAEAAPVEPEV